MEAPFNIINDFFKASVKKDRQIIRQCFSNDAKIVFLGEKYDADSFADLMVRPGKRKYGIDTLMVEYAPEDIFCTDFLTSVFSTDGRGQGFIRYYKVFLQWKIEEKDCLILSAKIQKNEHLGSKDGN